MHRSFSDAFSLMITSSDSSFFSMAFCTRLWMSWISSSRSLRTISLKCSFSAKKLSIRWYIWNEMEKKTEKEDGKGERKRRTEKVDEKIDRRKVKLERIFVKWILHENVSIIFEMTLDFFMHALCLIYCSCNGLFQYFKLEQIVPRLVHYRSLPSANGLIEFLVALQSYVSSLFHPQLESVWNAFQCIFLVFASLSVPFRVVRFHVGSLSGCWKKYLQDTLFSTYLISGHLVFIFSI